MFQPKTNWSPVYNEHGYEDLDGTYRRMVHNVRVLVEDYKYTVEQAVSTVENKMAVTFEESSRLLKEAKEKYNA